VATINLDGSVVFWESLTGQRFNHPIHNPDIEAGSVIHPPTHPYHTIGCIFNHKSFYANVQSSDCVLTASFDLNNKTHWKPMATEHILKATTDKLMISVPSFSPSSIDVTSVTSDLELQLMSSITQHRVVCHYY
jgi:centrosomal protein CEP76